MNVRLNIDRAVFVNVASVVRSKISDWAVKLKKAGIKGDGLSFSDPEKQKAHDPRVTINIGHVEHLTGNVGEISGQANISSQTAVAPVDLREVSSLLTLLRAADSLPNVEDKAIRQAAASLATELAQRQPEESRIREILRSIRTIAEGAVGNIAALQIAHQITKLLG